MEQNPNGWVQTVGAITPTDEALDLLRQAILTRVWRTLADVDPVVCTVERDGSRILVEVIGPPIDVRREHAVAVRVLDAVRSIGRTYGQVDVRYREPSEGHDGGVKRQRNEGDVHVGSMGGDVLPCPGSRTPEGRRTVAHLMDQVLDTVRRHARRKSPAPASRR